MIIDYRSDTVTKPTKEMLEAMFSANVGDDVFEEDPTVNELEKIAADMFGMEAALYCPSGTMTNQIAIKCH
ncbi:MAG: beta-eliminating lyase-related protein, partial [Chitinophagaceae bacterium]